MAVENLDRGGGGWGVAVLQKMQNPGSPNGPPMVDGWVVRLSSG